MQGGPPGLSDEGRLVCPPGTQPGRPDRITIPGEEQRQRFTAFVAERDTNRDERLQAFDPNLVNSLGECGRDGDLVTGQI